ncbi:MAG: hypothetical protein ABIH00_08300 [Armatimonadota bacterium]
MRPPGDICQPAIESPDTAHNPDGYCPHKWLIKKELPLSAFTSPAKDAVFDVIKSNLTNNIQNDKTARIISENVLNFNIIPPSAGTTFTLDYNGEALETDSKALAVQLISFKDMKYLNKAYFNENLLDKPTRLFVLDALTVPRN